MRKWDDLVDYLQEKDLIGKNSVKQEEKKSNPIVWILAIIGAVAAVAAIAYAVYRYMTPDYLCDFDDEYDDFEDDFFDDEEDEEPAKDEDKSAE